jgi:hypothetical protein
MRRRTLLITLGAGLASACGEAIDRQASGGAAPVPVTVLDEELTALKTAFNGAQSKVRLLFVAGPSCGPCLRGLMELNEALGADLLSDQRLSTLVVHVPTLGAEQHHAERAAQLLNGASVTHYWDPSGKSGDAVTEALGIAPIYAWDVWLIYPPGDQWEASAPPAPARWMHQLGQLPRETRLDPQAFAADVRARVEQLA